MKLLKLSQVLEKTSLSRATWYRLVADGIAPSQVRISARRVGWMDEEVERYLRQRSSVGRVKSHTKEN